MEQIIKIKGGITMNYIEIIILSDYEKRIIESGGIVIKYITFSPKETIVIKFSKSQLQVEKRSYQCLFY